MTIDNKKIRGKNFCLDYLKEARYIKFVFVLADEKTFKDYEMGTRE
jgi:hypothetical protein